MRVAAGEKISPRNLVLKSVAACVSRQGAIFRWISRWLQVEQNPFFCPDPDKIDALDELMRALKKEGDSIGAKVTVVASGFRWTWRAGL